jgi:hypothetical protein
MSFLLNNQSTIKILHFFKFIHFLFVCIVYLEPNKNYNIKILPEFRSQIRMVVLFTVIYILSERILMASN